jgi:hypothetical protein
VLRNKDFWVGLFVGLLVFYIYTNHIKKGGTSS